jgi:hypothetical protein
MMSKKMKYGLGKGHFPRRLNAAKQEKIDGDIDTLSTAFIFTRSSVCKTHFFFSRLFSIVVSTALFMGEEC